jgi:hypothetical protein
VAESMEAEAWSTRGGRPIWIGYSLRNRKGRPVGLRCSLSDTVPRAGGRRMQSPSTRPSHVPHPPYEGCTEGGSSGEEEGAPGPATTEEAQSYSDLFFGHLSCKLIFCCN